MVVEGVVTFCPLSGAFGGHVKLLLTKQTCAGAFGQLPAEKYVATHARVHFNGNTTLARRCPARATHLVRLRQRVRPGRPCAKSPSGYFCWRDQFTHAPPKAVIVTSTLGPEAKTPWRKTDACQRPTPSAKQV